MILLVFISLACSHLSVFAKNEKHATQPTRFIEIDNSDVKSDPEMVYNKYMNYNDANLALQSILASINDINNVSFDKKGNRNKPRKKHSEKDTSTRQNHIMIDNFGYVIRYKTDRNPDDNASFDRARRDIPVLNSSSLGIIRVTVIPPEGMAEDTSKLGTLHLKYVPRSGAVVRQTVNEQQKVPTSAGYTHDADTCKIYNDNLQELWATLSKYIEADNSIPHKIHLHNIALIIKAYLEHHTATNNEPNEETDKEKPYRSDSSREDENIVNEIIEDIKNNIASYKNGDVVKEIVDLVMNKLKPKANQIFSCKSIDEESLHAIIDLAYQKYIEDFDCREGKEGHDMIDLTRTARHPIKKTPILFSPYNQLRTNTNNRILRKSKRNIWVDYNDNRRINQLSKPIGPRPENPNKLYNEMLNLYEDENHISNSVRDCENLALKIFASSVKSIIERFLKRSECESHSQNKNRNLNRLKIRSNNNTKIIPNNLVKYIYLNKIQSDNKKMNNDFRIPVPLEYFKRNHAIPVYKTSIKIHKFPNIGSEKDHYIDSKNIKSIIETKNPFSIYKDPDVPEVPNITEINENDENFTEKQFNDNNVAKPSSDYISQEESNAISFNSLLNPVSDMTNPELAELTYIIRDPQVIMYQPQYLVKHRLRYETYLKNIKNILQQESSNGKIQLLKAVKILPKGNKLLYEYKNNENLLRYREKVSRKVLDVADVPISNNISLIPRDASTHMLKDHYIPSNISNRHPFDVKNNKTNVSNILVGNLSEKNNFENYETANYVETKSEEIFVAKDNNEAEKNKSNLQSRIMDKIGTEIHTNGHGKILWNNYPINIPKYTYNGGVDPENKNANNDMTSVKIIQFNK